MKTLTIATLILFPFFALASIEDERAELGRDPAALAAKLRERMAQQPQDVWLAYNAGVAAYAAKDFAKADELWAELASRELPDKLREQVWLQIGNVSYRVLDGRIEDQPEIALPRLEQSREAFRVTLGMNKKHQIARQNIVVVEKALEKVYALLAKRLLEEGKAESEATKAIEKLQAAQTYALQAEALNPKDSQRQRERTEIQHVLGKRFDQRAGEEEELADARDVEKPHERKLAIENLENALADFVQAKALNAQDITAIEGEKRVKKKLADLLAKTAREEQKQGESLAERAPEPAIEKLEQALEHFEQALALQPDHEDAKAGAEEVKADLAKLHLDAGDKQAQKGEQEKADNPSEAAENFQAALENFEAAKEVQPDNEFIQPRIDDVKAQLSEALTEAGEESLEAAEKAEEAGDLAEAQAEAQAAEAEFGQAEGLEPGNAEAKEGLGKAQAALARLGEKMGNKPGKPKPGPPKPGPPGPPQPPQDSFASMLAKVKEDQKNKEMHAQHHQGQRYAEERDKNPRNW